MRPKANYFKLVVLCGPAFLAGCCDHGDQWASSQTSNLVRQYNITPVFPFREDFQVGDIYQDPYGASDATPAPSVSQDNQFGTIGAWIDTLNMATALDIFYKARPSFPKTPGARRGHHFAPKWKDYLRRA